MPKLVLCKDGVVREIEAPFAVCCSMDDLDRLITELQRMRSYMGDATYGWFRVDLSHPATGAPTDTPPRRWTE